MPFENATSTDVSKGIRRTWYGNRETYVELVERAATKWRVWEQRLQTPFYHQVGSLSILHSFEPGSPMYESCKYLRERGADVKVLSAEQARKMFPQFVIYDGETCVNDAWAGYLESGRAVSHLAELARGEGVRIVENTRVTGVEEVGNGARVAVQGGSADFDRVVVAAGVWIGRLLEEVGRNLRVTRQQMVLIEVPKPSLFAHGSMPAWSVDPDSGGWYGFPLLREGYVKVSLEGPGETVDPDIERAGTREFAEAAMEFLSERIPEMAKGTVVEGRTCLYANTPDDHFLIDWAPGCTKILVAGGGSGHGFKFGGSIGEVISDALEDKANRLGDLFRIGDRFDARTPAERPYETRGFAIPTRST